MVSGLCAVVATSQTDGAALIVWYILGGRKNRGWGEEWFPGIAQKNKRKKRAGGKQLVVKHRGKCAGNGSGESVLLINKLN